MESLDLESNLEWIRMMNFSFQSQGWCSSMNNDVSCMLCYVASFQIVQGIAILLHWITLGFRDGNYHWVIPSEFLFRVRLKLYHYLHLLVYQSPVSSRYYYHLLFIWGDKTCWLFEGLRTSLGLNVWFCDVVFQTSPFCFLAWIRTFYYVPLTLLVSIGFELSLLAIFLFCH